MVMVLQLNVYCVTMYGTSQTSDGLTIVVWYVRTCEKNNIWMGPSVH